MGARTAFSRRNRTKTSSRRSLDLNLTFEDIMADLDPGWLARWQEAEQQNSQR